jgi:hypothetical protein
MRERLSRRRGFPDEAVDAAIQRMQELGYLDDGAFARFWVESRQTGTPRSRRALAFELSRKGVGRDELDAALEGVSDAEAAYDAAQRRLRLRQGGRHPRVCGFGTRIRGSPEPVGRLSEQFERELGVLFTAMGRIEQSVTETPSSHGALQVLALDARSSFDLARTGDFALERRPADQTA